jgi:hypothetical protein
MDILNRMGLIRKKFTYHISYLITICYVIFPKPFFFGPNEKIKKKRIVEIFGGRDRK